MATDTAVEVVMPQMGVSVSEGTITRWTKGVGDRIEADETIVEISTDKVDTEVPSPAAGTITALDAQEGETVPVGTRIAVIDTGRGGGGETRSEAPPRVEEARSASAPAEPAGDGEGESTGPRGAAAPQRATPAQAGGDGGNGDGSGRTFVSPVVARMLAEHGLDVGAIPGTGRGGRVTKKDVQAFIDSGGAAAAPAGAVVHDVPHFAPPAEPQAPAGPGAPSAPARPAAPVTAGDIGAGEELYQFNTIRKVIARHMRHSLETAAQVTTVIEVDMTRVVEMRRRWKPAYAERYGVNLTYIPFVALATIDAIRQWPWVNAEVRGDSAIIKRYVNLGMAVAIDDAKGLMVPVVHDAETLNIVGLSKAVIEKAEKARTKTLTPDEMAGGTFTITNPGVFGALMGTPIIPEGQVAILDVEAIVKRPMVVTDEFGGDSIAIRHMMYLCLSYDHRLVDGAYAAQFMALLKRNLETWDDARFGLS